MAFALTRNTLGILLLSIATSSALAAVNCSDDQVSAVKLVTHHKIAMPGSGMMGGIEADKTHYFSVEGDEYVLEEGKRQLPTGTMTEQGMAMRWEDYSKETWHVGTDNYRALHSNQGDTFRHSKSTPRAWNSSEPIEQVDSLNAAAERAAGYNCRLNEKSVGGAKHSVCTIKIYGRNTPVASSMKSRGMEQHEETTSLEQLCVDRSVFNVPARDWK